jgi:multiple antibiotic resistance protein
MLVAGLQPYIASFISLFVAMDAVGTLPIFISLTDGLKKQEKQQIIWQSLLTATLVSLAFMFVGKGIFFLLGITVADFQIGGGLVLLILSIMDIVQAGKERRRPSPTMGVVPIGMPLIVGPAVLTTLIIQLDTYGFVPTTVALLLNLGFVTLIFLRSEVLTRWLGEGGARAASKVVSLLLAAIAVMMIRKGVTEVIRQVHL